MDGFTAAERPVETLISPKSFADLAGDCAGIKIARFWSGQLDAHFVQTGFFEFQWLFFK